MKRVEIEDILKYRYLENLLYNPGGTAYVYNVAYADADKNTYRRDVWAVKNGRPFQLTATIDASISFWNSDSELIISRKKPGDEKSEDAELYTISIDGGEAKLWAKLPVAPGDIKKISEGLYAFTAQIEEKDPDAYLDDADTRKKKSEDKKKNLEEDYDVFTEVPYWFNGKGVSEGKRDALFIMRRKGDSIEKGPKSEETESINECKESESLTDNMKKENAFELIRITAPDFNVNDFKIDGDRIYFTGEKATKIPEFYNDLFCYDTKTEKLTEVYNRHNIGIEQFEVKDGEAYVFASDYKDYGINQSTNLYAVKDNEIVKIDAYKPTHSIGNSIVGDMAIGGGKQAKLLQEDGKMVLYTLATIEDHTAIERIELATGNKQVVLDLSGDIYFFDIIDENFVLSYSDKNHLPEIYTIAKKNLKTSEIKDQEHYTPADNRDVLTQISSHNTEHLKDLYIAEPERIDYKSEGLELHGWVLLPENYDASKKYPAVLDIHGGPRCVYCNSFFHEMQVWAARGFVVMFTNIKGSDGRGDDFADIRGDYGGTDYKNLMAFVDAVLEKYPSIDENRICETGGSYGGFMTNWVVTHTDRFCCAASQRSISNWLSMTYISDIGPYFGPDQNGVDYDDFYKTLNHDALWDHSPLKYVDNAKTPTLFLHSDEDYRCPLPEAMQMMQAMTVRGVETRMIVFHGENHELSRSGKPMHRIRRLKEITDWFEKHTK